jgi:signal transduction histidine kinase
VRLQITDDGPGIPEAELKRIFDRFYRAQGQRAGDSGGAGLGLAIAQRLVDLHGGTMRAENVAEGRGARFTIELPRIAEPV